MQHHAKLSKITRLFTSIAIRISLSIAFVVAGTTIFVTWFILNEERQVLESELKSKGLYIVRVISHQLIEPLLYEDRYAIYSILRSALVEEKGIVIFAEVFDAYGESIVRTDEDTERFSAIDKSLLLSYKSPTVNEQSDGINYEIISPIESKGLGIVGYLRFSITKRFLLDVIEKTRQKLYFYSSGIIIIGILAGLWMARKIIRPVLILNQGVNKLKSGELGVEVGIVGEGEIKELSKAFNEMSRQLKEKEEEAKAAQESLIRKEKLYVLGEFSACLAHEIKNPLTSIKMLIQGARQKGNVMSVKDILVVEDEINRVDRIVTEFLAFARPGKMVFNNVQLNTLLAEIIRLIRANINRAKIEVVSRYADDLPTVRANSDNLKQLFLNIVLNAMQAMQNNGILTLETYYYDKQHSVVAKISDTGCGIEEENLQKIFDPFFTTKENGTGMGLALAYKIVKEHGGTIDVDSERDKGTTFKVTFPIKQMDSNNGLNSQQGGVR